MHSKLTKTLRIEGPFDLALVGRSTFGWLRVSIAMSDKRQFRARTPRALHLRNLTTRLPQHSCTLGAIALTELPLSSREEKHMTVTGIITALIVGLIIGALARLVLPGKQNIPIWLTILLGWLGAVLGTLLAQNLGVAVTPGIDWIEIVLQVAVAAVGIALVASVYGRRRVDH